MLHDQVKTNEHIKRTFNNKNVCYMLVCIHLQKNITLISKSQFKYFYPYLKDF